MLETISMWLTKVMETCSAVRAPVCKDSQAGKAGKAVECKHSGTSRSQHAWNTGYQYGSLKYFSPKTCGAPCQANALWPRFTARSISATHKLTSHIGVTHWAMNLG